MSAEQAPPPVTYKVDSGVALITWNRPDRNNAWGPDLEQGYFAALRRAANDVDVRTIVVTGEGRHFCPGTDFRQLSDIAEGDRSTDPENREPQTFPMTIPKPIIAAIHGACAGTGFIQAAVVDVRFADADSRITPAFVRRGIMAEHGLSVLLPAIVGFGAAVDLLMSGRVLTAAQARECGFVTHVSPTGKVLEQALAFATDIATRCSPIAMALTKRQLYARLQPALEDARLEAMRLWGTLRTHGDFREGIDSFRHGRDPQFAGLRNDALGAYGET